MKKTILIITLAAVLGLLAVACHDEPVNPSPSVRNVGYIACGDQHQVSVNGDESWHALLDSLFAAAESGCKVTFWNPNAFGSKQADTVTINTADRQQAYRWGEEMYDQGYIVSIVYDENTGTYRGTAIKCASNVSNYTPIPLSEYLQGTWELDSSCVWYFADRPQYSPFSPIINTEHFIVSLYGPLNLVWRDTQCHYYGQLFNPDLYRPEELVISTESIVSPYPDPNHLWAEYDSLGYNDSTITYQYDIENYYTIRLTSPYQIPCQAANDTAFFPSYGYYFITQVNQDYMLIYGYKPVFYEPGQAYVSNVCFGFIRR